MLCNNIINSWKTILNGSLVKWCNKTLPNVLGQILSGEENLDITNDKLLKMICILLVEGSGFTACVLIGRHLMGTADQPEVDFCFSFFFHLRCYSGHNSLSPSHPIKTRPSILCVTHQMSCKKRDYSVDWTVPYEMMNYKWYLMVLGQYMTILAGTWSV